MALRLRVWPHPEANCRGIVAGLGEALLAHNQRCAFALFQTPVAGEAPAAPWAARSGLTATVVDGGGIVLCDVVSMHCVRVDFFDDKVIIHAGALSAAFGSSFFEPPRVPRKPRTQ